ncbi:MAG: DUF3795 domain-containing protein [Candidatus Helarchaeota archaeon]
MNLENNQPDSMKINDKNELLTDEIAILGKCGIFCAACDAYIGKAKAKAKDLFDNLGIDEGKAQTAADELLEIMDQINYDDGVGCFILGIPLRQYSNFKKVLMKFAEKPVSGEEDTGFEDFKDFQRVLRKLADSSTCPGCGLIGAARSCPIVICCEERGFLTCAECPDIQKHHICKTILEKQIPSMITDNCTYFQLITRRYTNWNVQNLNKISRKGYKKYLREMKERVENGFHSRQVISKECVFRDLLGI